MHWQPVWIVLLIATLFTRPLAAQAPFDDLVSKVPSTANALFLLNVDKILASPAAAAGNWKAKAQEAYTSGVTILPPDSTQAIMASHFDLESMTPIWEAAVMKLNAEPSLSLFARSAKGALSKLDDQNIVALPSDAYLVQFAPKVVGAISPANRQTVARWIRQAKNSPKGELSPYLKEAYSYANNLGTPAILTLDLEDAISVEHVREAVTSSETLTKAKVDVEKAIKFLTGIRGVTLGLTFNDKVFGKIRVDFREKVTAPPELAKSLVLESLAQHGATLNELYEWKPSTDGNSFMLEGHLEQGGLRRIFSLFDRPPSVPKMADETKPAPTTQQRPDQAEVDATRAYLKHVSDMLDDLRKEPRENPNYTVGQTGVWYDTYARKIDRLPTLYVDPAAAEFGMSASGNLRAASTSIRTGAAQGRIGVTSAPKIYNTYTQTSVYGYGYRWGGGVVPYGYQNTYNVEDVSAELQQRTAIKTQTRVTSMNQAKSSVDQIYADLSNIRKQMTEKYKVAF